MSCRGQSECSPWPRRSARGISVASTTDAQAVEDALLGGRLRLLQPAVGYRSAIDPILLAAVVPARNGQRVLDLGCGVGTAMLCLAARVPDVAVAGLEIQGDMAA